MSFLYPSFLFALLALAIPVVIHLFNFRRYKTLYFSNVQLLKLIKQESRKKSQIKQLLILAARLLTIASLVVAFSRPYIPLSDRTSTSARHTVAIYIDNTFSMKNVGEKGPLLEQAKLKAVDIANAYMAGTQYLLITSDMLPQHQFLLTKEQFIQQVSEIRESPQSPNFSDIYNHVVRTISGTSKKSDKTFYYLSDFQKNKDDFELLKADSSVWTYLMPFTSEKNNNLLIDSCWFEVPGRKIGQQEQLFVKLKNLSDQAYQNIPVRLTINDSLRAITNISIAGQEELTVELNFTNNTEGIQLCKIELDDYPIIYDNSYFLSYNVRAKLNALGIYNPANNSSVFLKALFADDELIEYSEFTENNVQIARLKEFQCIFMVNNQKISSGLISELISYVEQGGTLALLPDRSGSFADYNKLLTSLNGPAVTSIDTASMGISEINLTHDLYNQVFKKQEVNANLPKVKGVLKFSDQIQQSEISLLKFRNGKNALSVFRYGNGQVYSFAFPVDNENIGFVRHILFVPTFYNIALYSDKPQKYSYSFEVDEPVVLNDNQVSDELIITSRQTSEEFRVSARNIGAGYKQLNLNNLITEAGHYMVNDGNRPVQSVSYNFPRKESSSDFHTASSLQELISKNNLKQLQILETSKADFSETLQELNNGKQLWKFFIILAIVFILCELAVIRFWK
jgi:hypothetical protein